MANGSIRLCDCEALSCVIAVRLVTCFLDICFIQISWFSALSGHHMAINFSNFLVHTMKASRSCLRCYTCSNDRGGFVLLLIFVFNYAFNIWFFEFFFLIYSIVFCVLDFQIRCLVFHSQEVDFFLCMKLYLLNTNTL